MKLDDLLKHILHFKKNYKKHLKRERIIGFKNTKVSKDLPVVTKKLIYVKDKTKDFLNNTDIASNLTVKSSFK